MTPPSTFSDLLIAINQGNDEKFQAIMQEWAIKTGILTIGNPDRRNDDPQIYST